MTFTHANFPGHSSPVQAEVVEMERQGEQSRIHIVRVSGIEAYIARNLIPSWVDQTQVDWFTEGSA